MDSQQQKFQSMGFFGIVKEAYKTIFEAKKIFTLITLAMIFPLSCIMFFHLHILNFLFQRIDLTYVNLYYTASGSAVAKGIVHHLVLLWIVFFISNAAYLFFVFILYLVSTSSVVYTMMCIYAGKVLAFRELLNVVQKVLKRFMIHRVWLMLFYQIVTLVFLIYMCIWDLAVEQYRGSVVTMGVLVLLAALSVILYGFMNLDWQLACVISIFEDLSDTLGESKNITLRKGKQRLAITIAVGLQLSVIIVLMGYFYLLVAHGKSLGTVSKVSCGIMSILLLSVTILLGLVVQTLFYFVCKAYHGENIDKKCLATTLEAFIADKTAHQLQNLTVV
ncbi:hypothetical protein AQUCO_01500141v1 [Aquilegia coerulea]|uniref:Uncharacterized protein n=1 Tax=Aquilegia coerulea TaxID=218851 RepID=A0A2G5DSC4_AQUCA|nr:hypothetical protein AQUCO_01500141v1 [Aquilegia coerulea]